MCLKLADDNNTRVTIDHEDPQIFAVFNTKRKCNTCLLRRLFREQLHGLREHGLRKLGEEAPARRTKAVAVRLGGVSDSTLTVAVGTMSAKVMTVSLALALVLFLTPRKRLAFALVLVVANRTEVHLPVSQDSCTFYSHILPGTCANSPRRRGGASSLSDAVLTALILP